MDDLICSPRDALRFCQVIRSESNSPFMSDGVILKALVNIRKRKDCPTGLKGKRQPKSTQRELDQVGYNGDAREFKELAVDCLADMYKSRTIDEIACFPREAIQLCDYVRNKAKCQGLTDAFVLSTLMNVRKAGGN